MKRTVIAAVAALVAASPIAAATASAQGYRGDRHDNRGDNNGRRDNDRNNRRWDQSRDNGFYLNGRFYYGQPSQAQMRGRDFRPGWQQWRRGDRLPSYARARYHEVDWRRAHYRAPPRGYHYIRDDRGQVLLVGVATGVILSILLSN